MTAQEHERLIHEGEPTTMMTTPSLPEGHPGLVARPEERIGSTGCWRGYVGTWEIADGRLYLVGLRGAFELAHGPLFADWYSGVLSVPRGRVLRYVHMGFQTVFEEELLIKVEQGCVVSTLTIDNRGREFDERGFPVMPPPLEPPPLRPPSTSPLPIPHPLDPDETDR